MWVDPLAAASGATEPVARTTTIATNGRAKLSAFVISYNRSALLRTCLKALAFADEIIVVDKSSTDDSLAVAGQLADRVISVPWSPTVEETRGFALAQCTHEWVLCLDDDECLSPEAVLAIDRELHAPRADIYFLPLRHYILGRHEERAYYWPELHPRLFRRGSISFRATVHAGIVQHSEHRLELPADEGVCIHHLSHHDAFEWIAKTNRYTSRPDRHRSDPDGADLIDFAHRRIDFWMGRSRDSDRADYPAAVAVLRAIYDMIDRVKTWEVEAGLDGAVSFPRITHRLEAAYGARLGHLERRRAAPVSRSRPDAAPAQDAPKPERSARAAQALATALRAAREAQETTRRNVEAQQQVAERLRAELAACHASTLWRMTGPIRRLGRRFPALPRAIHAARRGVVRGGRDERVTKPENASMPPPRVALIASAEPEEIAFPHQPDPVVSVIVPSFGQVGYTLRCLAAMARDLPATPIEVIVVDDASGDPEVACLHRVRGIRLVSHAENLGFLRSCNRVATQARGEFLLFLNNDTQPQAGWLDPMVSLLRARADAGAVGSQLLFPDGRLQEAGGIIWNNGRGWTYGRDDDPDQSAYAYVREVDYASGASLLVRRELFAALGGFDEAFAPAYCEDSDLAFRIRQAGLKVLYQPKSCVVHFESVTNGADPAAGVKRFNDLNHPKLVGKWADLLASEHAPPGTALVRACQRGRGRPLVLIVADRLPPEQEPTVRALLDAGVIVKLAAAEAEERREALQQLGIEVLRPDALAGWIEANGGELDSAILAGVANAEGCLPDLLTRSDGKILFVSDGAGVDWRERGVWRCADLVLHPTEQDRQAAELLEPAVDSCCASAVNWPGLVASSRAAARSCAPT